MKKHFRVIFTETKKIILKITITSKTSIVFGCVSANRRTYDIICPLGKGPGSQEMATLLESGAAALSAAGGELGLPLSEVNMTTDGAEYTGSPALLRPAKKIAIRNWKIITKLTSSKESNNYE